MFMRFFICISRANKMLMLNVHVFNNNNSNNNNNNNNDNRITCVYV